MLTDNEIIKALECCIRDNVSCDGCPAVGVCQHDPDCPKSIALDLINRQKAEIEKLELLNASLLESCAGYSKACDTYKAEIERLMREKYRVTEDAVKICVAHQTAKADAIKEFAERLKVIFDRNAADYVYYVIVDDVVKEMGGGNDADM